MSSITWLTKVCFSLLIDFKVSFSFTTAVVVVQLPSHVQLFVSPWTAALQSSLSFTVSRSLLKLMFLDLVMPSNHLILYMFLDLVMPSNHLILYHPLLLLPSVFPSIRVSYEWALCIGGPEYWSFSISPLNEYSWLISSSIDWFDLLAVQGTLKSLLLTSQFKSINSLTLSLLCGPTLTSIHDYWKNHNFDYADLGRQSKVDSCYWWHDINL